MRRLSSLAFVVLALAASPALAANPQVEMETTAGTIKVNRYVVDQGEQRAVVLYWYQNSRRVIAGCCSATRTSTRSSSPISGS